jgi:hypothetical protein
LSSSSLLSSSSSSATSDTRDLEKCAAVLGAAAFPEAGAVRAARVVDRVVRPGVMVDIDEADDCREVGFLWWAGGG